MKILKIAMISSAVVALMTLSTATAPVAKAQSLVVQEFKATLEKKLGKIANSSQNLRKFPKKYVKKLPKPKTKFTRLNRQLKKLQPNRLDRARDLAQRRVNSLMKRIEPKFAKKYTRLVSKPLKRLPQSQTTAGLSNAGSNANLATITQSNALALGATNVVIGAVVTIGAVSYIVTKDDDSNTTATGNQ